MTSGKKTDSVSRTDRIALELARLGGLVGEFWRTMPEVDRETWHDQAVVLSYLREGLGLVTAAYAANLQPEVVEDWDARNLLQFNVARRFAEREHAESVMKKIGNQIEAGEMKNPSVISMWFKYRSPALMDPPVEEERGLIAELRRVNRSDAEIEQEVNRRVAIELARHGMMYEDSSETAQVEGEGGELPPIDLSSRRPQPDGISGDPERNNPTGLGAAFPGAHQEEDWI